MEFPIYKESPFIYFLTIYLLGKYTSIFNNNNNLIIV